MKMTKLIRPQTVKLIARLLNPLTESNLIMVPEYREIIAQLQHLATHGEPLPVVVPKMINQSEAADMLGISLSNFKKQEAEGAFPFKRRMIGSAVRYRNTDIVKFILSDS